MTNKRINTAPSCNLRKILPALFTLILIFCFSFTACTGNFFAQKADPESDFETKLIDGGKGVEITGYIGNNLKVVIPSKIQEIPVTVIGKKAFTKKDLTNVTIPDSVTSIGGLAFAANQLTSVTIPNSVTTIGESVFTCNRLTSVTIGANVVLDSNSFDIGFDDTYIKIGRLAGTYTRLNTESETWTYGSSSAGSALKVNSNAGSAKTMEETVAYMRVINNKSLLLQ